MPSAAWAVLVSNVIPHACWNWKQKASCHGSASVTQSKEIYSYTHLQARQDLTVTATSFPACLLPPVLGLVRMTGGRKQGCGMVFILMLIFRRGLAVISVRCVRGSHLTKEILQEALSYRSGKKKLFLNFI